MYNNPPHRYGVLFPSEQLHWLHAEACRTLIIDIHSILKLHLCALKNAYVSKAMCAHFFSLRPIDPQSYGRHVLKRSRVLHLLQHLLALRNPRSLRRVAVYCFSQLMITLRGTEAIVYAFISPYKYFGCAC